MKISHYYCITSLLLLILFCFSEGWRADPTYGFTVVPLTEWNFELQKPYDVPLEEHYSYENGVRKLWVYADDKPHDPNSLTQPRTEVRIRVLFLSLPLSSSAYTPCLNIVLSL